MRLKSISKILLLSIGAMVFSILFSPLTGCKDPGPGKAVITVLDSLKQPISNAKVELTSKDNQPPGDVSDLQTTDVNGNTYHEFELEMILKVKVEKFGYTAPNENIHIIPDETAQLTVIMDKN
jgi:hypothetical protein